MSYTRDDAVRDIGNIFPPTETITGQVLLLEVIDEIGLEKALTTEALLLLGQKERQTQN